MPRVMVAAAVVVALLGAGPAVAQEADEEVVLIQVDVVARGPEGTIVPIAEVTIEPRLVGATCVGTVTVENNSSEHPYNDYILSSGGTTEEILDFERVAGQITTMKARFVLGETMTASIRLGPDRVASLAGDTVVVASTCQPPPPTTTTTMPPATTTTMPPAPTTSTLPPATTTTETPVGGVSAGGGAVSGRHAALSPAMVGIGALSLIAAFGLAMRGREPTDR